VQTRRQRKAAGNVLVETTVALSVRLFTKFLKAWMSEEDRADNAEEPEDDGYATGSSNEGGEDDEGDDDDEDDEDEEDEDDEDEEDDTARDAQYVRRASDAPISSSLASSSSSRPGRAAGAHDDAALAAEAAAALGEPGPAVARFLYVWWANDPSPAEVSRSCWADAPEPFCRCCRSQSLCCCAHPVVSARDPEPTGDAAAAAAAATPVESAAAPGSRERVRFLYV
jgi:hypothetical protein